MSKGGAMSKKKDVVSHSNGLETTEEPRPGLPTFAGGFRGKLPASRVENLQSTCILLFAEFLSGCLSGEGDVLRHLAALGYHLTHQQVRDSCDLSAECRDHDGHFRIGTNSPFGKLALQVRHLFQEKLRVPQKEFRDANSFERSFVFPETVHGRRCFFPGLSLIGH
jgi:hypothetical protein